MTVYECCLIKLLPYILLEKTLTFYIGNGQPRESAVCSLYRRTFVPYSFSVSCIMRDYKKRWLGSRVVGVLVPGAEGPGSNRSRDAVG